MPSYPFTTTHKKTSCYPNPPPFSSATAATITATGTTAMHFSRLCFVLPSEGDGNPPRDRDHPEKRPEKRPEKPGKKHRSCGVPVHGLVRRAFRRLNDTRQDFEFCGCVRGRNSSGFHDTEGVGFPNDNAFTGHSPKIFGYSELYIGTKGFSKDEILGSGGFGRVYRAVLPSDGTVVAVKCLVETGERFEKTFAAELAAVAHLRHRNLVPLRGWCVNDDQLLLVYDYMPNRSLDRVLFGRAAGLLAWERRVKIVKGLATALFYLHEQLEAQIIHRDVKTSNVMLDSRFNARLGDFGLARWLEHELRYQIGVPSSSSSSPNRRKFRVTDTSRIGGTIGYLSPESFQKRGVATAKSDVFSFGIVLLEIASGRKAVDLAFPDDRIVLLDWIRELADDRLLLQAADHRLRDGSYKLHDMEHLIRLGLLCTVHDPKSRPDMRWIVDAISGNNCEKLPELPSFKSHPRYISVSPLISSSSNVSNTGTTPSSITATTITVSSTAFITAKGESLYATTELESSDDGTIASSRLSCRQSKIFPMVQPPREITYNEIVSATDNFSDSNRLAELDFGTAYYGVLDAHDVIVKRLGMKTCPALRARFSNELSNLGRLCHRNLVQLHGWCTEQGEMLVVYNYSASRVLGQLLHHNHRTPHPVLRWTHRVGIVKSLAGAIQYLHNEWEEQVIHRNITSSAVYVEADMNPKLGSFALAEFLTRNEHDHHADTDTKTSVRGIFGYMAPEYMGSGEAATPMADVYSFGVVVLEVVSGQMAVDFRKPDVLLVKRVHKFETRKTDYKQLVDPRLDGDYDQIELVRLVKLAIACTRSDPDCRPTMSQVVSILDGRDKCLTEVGKKKEKPEEWRERNELSLSLVRRVQALGIQ